LVSHLCGLNDLFLQVSEFERGTSMTHTTRWLRHCTACMLLNPNGMHAVNTQKNIYETKYSSFENPDSLPFEKYCALDLCIPLYKYKLCTYVTDMLGFCIAHCSFLYLHQAVSLRGRGQTQKMARGPGR